MQQVLILVYYDCLGSIKSKDYLTTQLIVQSQQDFDNNFFLFELWIRHLIGKILKRIVVTFTFLRTLCFVTFY